MKKLSEIHSLIWKPDFSVKVVELDKQHKKIFAFINLLNEALTSHDRSIVITIRDVLVELGEYANYHFANEEKYFDKFNYEETEKHITEHNNYRTRIELFNNRLRTVHEEGDNMQTFGLDLFEFLEGWWIGHINNSDHKYSKCFNEHGLF